MTRAAALLILLAVACGEQGPGDPTRAAEPAVKGASVVDPDPDPDPDPARPVLSLPTYDTRDPQAPSAGAWLPSAWYCRLPKTPDPVAQAESDEGWERRALDLYSWDAFIAIHWPQRWDGNAWLAADTLEVTDDAWIPRFGSWWNDVDVPSLSTDGPFLRTSEDGWQCEGECLQTALAGEHYPPGDNGLWDRSGRLIRFETRMNDALVGALDPKATRLSFQTGQCASQYPRMVCKGGACERCGTQPPLRSCIPSGPEETVIGDTFDFDAAIEIKLAWRVLDPQEDDYGRFVVMRGVLVDAEREDLGLIAMHVLQKPKTHPQWTWSSFEHVDNLEGHDGQPPSFRAGPCPNTLPANGPLRDTRLTRTSPIEASTAELNRQVRARLTEQRSPLAYYELVGTQYSRYGHTRTPKREVANTIPDCSHEADLAKTVVTPKTLRNTVIEPYLVPPTEACPNVIRPQKSSCMGCHAAAPTCDFSFIEERLGTARG